MNDEFEKSLDNEIFEIESEKARGVASEKAVQDQEKEKGRLLEINYLKLITPIENRIFKEMAPIKMINLFENFSNKLESVINLEHKDWNSMWPNQKQNSFITFNYNVEWFDKKGSLLNKEQILSLPKDQLTAENASITAMWELFTLSGKEEKPKFRNGGYVGIHMYYGFKCKSDGKIEWFFGPDKKQAYDDEAQDSPNTLIKSMAQILTSGYASNYGEKRYVHERNSEEFN